MSDNKGFFGPQSMWLGMGVAAALFLAWRSFAPQPEPDSAPVAVRNVGSGPEARVEKITRAQCLAREGRVWVTLPDGVECISFVASTKAQDAGQALVFFDGDVKESELAAATQDSAREPYQRRADTWAARYGVPVVIVGRPGLMGSSGFHLLGGRRDEGAVLDGAIDPIKERLGIRRLALAGQSGGARIVAQLMVSGRRDISCAAMGSGAYGLPRLVGGGTSSTNIFGDPGRRFLVPMLKAGDIPVAANRRAFVIGDPRDKVTPFSEQKAWADKLASLGHHVQLIEAEAKDPDHHGMTANALTAAALCLQDKSDAEIRTAVTAR